MTAEVTAVVGACGPERHRYARRLADARQAQVVSAQRIASDAGAVELAIALADQHRSSSPLVLEYPLQTPTLHIIGEILDGSQPAVLSDLVCVVDAPHLLSDLASAEHLRVSHQTDSEDRHVFASRAELVVTQIEYASTVVLINAETMTFPELNLMLSLISHLAPKAQIDVAEASSELLTGSTPGSFTEEQTQAGWISLLNGDFEPRFQDSNVVAVRYEQLRPVHPGRLSEVMSHYTDSEKAGLLLRSAGFAHLATRPHITAYWNQVGRHLALSPAAFDHQLESDDEPLAFGQDLAFLGVGIAVDQLAEDLDRAALTDQELQAGPGLWSTFADPFPEWRTADH